MSRMILALSLLPTTAYGAIVAVPADQPTLQDAITNSVAGDIISLADGTYDVDVTIPHNLTIEGAAGATVILTNTSTTSGQILLVDAAVTNFVLRDVTIGASGNNRAVTSAGRDLRFENITAASLTTDTDGAFLLASEPRNVIFDQVDIFGVTAENGGAIHIDRTDTTTSAGHLQISDSTFESGEVTGNGGLIYTNNTRLTLTDSVLSDGTAAYGGAIFATSTGVLRQLTITTSDIGSNAAFELGGGVYTEGQTVTVQDSSISFNSAGSGAGLWVDAQATANVQLRLQSSSTLTGNFAHGLGSTPEGLMGSGSAAHLVGRDLMVTAQSTISDNIGTTGTIFATIQNLTFDNATLSGNEASGSYGGIVATTLQSSNVRNSTFSQNSAGGDAGALSLDAGNITLFRNTFAENSAGGDGGAVLLGGDAVPVITQGRFIDNEAVRGGALFQDVGTAVHDITAENVEFFRNQADEGGALWVAGIDQLELSGNHWCENSAGTPGIGGAAWFSGSGNATVSNESVNDNVGVVGGAFAFVGFGDLDVAQVTFAGNSAVDGAAIDATDISGTTTLTNLAVTGSAGVLFNATNSGALTATRIGTTDNDASGTLGGVWTAETVVDPVDLDDVFLYNNHPASSCEETRLYPHARNTTLRGEAGVSEDIGMSGGAGADPFLTVDVDGDGYDRKDDCGDDDSAIENPGATDICDGIDNDCDLQPGDPEGTGIDEEPDTAWYLDTDADGYGDPATAYDSPSCDAPGPLYVDDDSDCDDADPLVNPEADEVCDGIDNDCDDTIDIGASDAIEFFPDDDYDGYGRETNTVFECSQPAGYVAVAGDCDDTLASVRPGATERCDTIDNDCDGDIDGGAINAPLWYPDVDGDGYGDDTQPGVESCLPPQGHSPYGGDCDDADPDRNPGEPEVCDGIDNDCDGTVDVEPVSPIYYPDGDGDGFGDIGGATVASCTPVPGMILDGGDCDDTNAAIRPGAVETCDGIDEDCDGEIDDNPNGGNTYYLDADYDGYGNPAFTRQACSLPNGYVEDGTDCDDQEENANPGATEMCDQIDNDCDGVVDEPDAADASTWYADIDDDNYGDDAQTRLACTAPIGHVPQGGDCDDQNPSAFPGRPEVCDQVDNDCDGVVDGQNAEDIRFFFEDADGDGYGDPSSELGACFQPEGYVNDSTDCDDTDANVNPAAAEVANNGIDDNCDGQRLTVEDTGGETPEEGCGGCSSSSNSASFAMLPFLGALLLRRRR